MLDAAVRGCSHDVSDPSGALEFSDLLTRGGCLAFSHGFFRMIRLVEADLPLGTRRAGDGVGF